MLDFDDVFRPIECTNCERSSFGRIMALVQSDEAGTGNTQWFRNSDCNGTRARSLQRQSGICLQHPVCLVFILSLYRVDLW